MKFKLSNFAVILVLAFFAGIFGSQDVYGASYVKGQSLVAENQIKASKGLSFPGMDITWLDLGDDHIQAFSSMDKYSEGIFTLRMSSETICFDTTGKIIAASDYNGVYEFSDGMAKVYRYIIPAGSGRLVAPPAQEEGFIDKEGNEVIPLGKFSGTGSGFHEGLTSIGGYGAKKGYINKAGEIVIPQIYRDAGDFSEGLAPVQSADTELWGYIDKDGKQVIPAEYEKASAFSEETAYVVKNGMAGYIDKSGNTVIDFKFKPEVREYLQMGFHNGLAVAQDSSGKYGYIDKTGSFVIPAKYKEAEPFIGDAAFVTSENQNYTNGYGSSFLINRSGERLTPLWQYGRYSGEYMREGLIRALSSYGPSRNEYVVMLNQYGAEVIPSSLHIENISSFNEGFALLTAFNNGEMAVGLVRKPKNIEEYKTGKLIKVFIDGKQLDFADIDPIIENSRALVPMRAIFEALGAEIAWDDTLKTVTATKEDIEVSLKIGDTTGYINGKPVVLDTPAKIKSARTVVPVRFIAESLGMDVTWDASLQSVTVETP